ncbi:hypothetical protein J2Z18_005176 [Paenibacillus lactis]|uniref:Uncharacterized protein n=2 Tax=Paenibacillus lactis TaxID=228574 RepID=G4HEB9_9BACL|nr:hypothetical protein PaelaDRAFT_2330 [Paenibacillus lactis 154]MBP1896066.1 hypothetical protein [Paenibacillus lactis]
MKEQSLLPNGSIVILKEGEGGADEFDSMLRPWNRS